MPRGSGFHGGNPVLSLGVGVAAGVAIAALAAPRYAPGHTVHRLPKGAVSIKHNGVHYRFHNGIYYRYIDDDYRVVLPPAGLIVQSLPPHPDTLFVDGETYYVVEGVYYKRLGNDYIVVNAPITTKSAESAGYQAGQHYPSLPDGAQPVKIDNIQYFTYGGLYFLPQSENGQVSYLAMKFN
jgi:hypothetical protein